MQPGFKKALNDLIGLPDFKTYRQVFITEFALKDETVFGNTFVNPTDLVLTLNGDRIVSVDGESILTLNGFIPL